VSDLERPVVGSVGDGERFQEIQKCGKSEGVRRLEPLDRVLLI
jgi:hypothetical protein